MVVTDQLAGLYTMRTLSIIDLDVYFYSSDVCDGAFLGTEPTITCSKLTTETLEQGVKHVQSQQ